MPRLSLPDKARKLKNDFQNLEDWGNFDPITAKIKGQLATKRLWRQPVIVEKRSPG
jgi:hypothetical protein